MILRLKLLTCDVALKEVLRLRVDTERQLPSLCHWRCLMTFRLSWTWRLTWTSRLCLRSRCGELGILMTALGQTETHVAEIFSPGRSTVRARRFVLRPGTAIPNDGGRWHVKACNT